MKKSKGLIFDFDDTLFKTKQVRVKALIYWARKYYGLKVSKEDVLKKWGLPFDKFIPSFIGKDKDPKQAKENYYKVIPKFPNVPYEGVVEALLELNKEYHLGILTAANMKLISADLDKCNIPLKLFSYIQTQESTLVHKPDPKVFKPILDNFKELGIASSDIIYVGDSKDDFDAAKAVGIEFIAVAGNSVPEYIWNELGCRSIKRITDLKKAIEGR